MTTSDSAHTGAARPGSVLGLVAIVLAVIVFLCALLGGWVSGLNSLIWISYLGTWVPVLVGVVGAVFSAVALSVSGARGGRSTALRGLILSIAAIVLSLAGVLVR